jgi:pimeloyl-ACP methyl ester carboxylesterase
MRDLVLLPGFMCDADLWTDMVPDLSLLGPLHFGNVYEDDSLDGMARRVLDEGPPTFVLVGFSMGGFVARRLALAAPQRVLGVAFISSSARGYTPDENARKRMSVRAPAPADAPVERSPATARGLHPDRERDPVLIERLRAMQRRLGPAVMARQAALVRHDGYAELERIACPALVIACRQDRLRRFDETERMAHHLPRSEFAVIEDCGHMAPLERPRELAARLRGWMEQNGL